MDKEYKMGSVVTMKKQHPCGSKLWEIIRIGVDFKFKCKGCKHIIMIQFLQQVLTKWQNYVRCRKSER